MAAALLRNEVLERADIDLIMAGTPHLKSARRPACAWSPPRPPRRLNLKRGWHTKRALVPTTSANAEVLERHPLDAVLADLAVGVGLGARRRVGLDHV